MKEKLTLLMAQINVTTGAISANCQKITAIIQEHQASHDVIVFPELAITGYPPEDLLFRDDFLAQSDQAVRHIAEQTGSAYIVLGHPSRIDGLLYNSASILHQGQCVATYHKQALPGYGVFDEPRYFTPGPATPLVTIIKGHRVALCICEDIWQDKVVNRIIDVGVDVLLSLNASPFHDSKYQLREKLVHGHTQAGTAIVYVNMVGGQDELVFDGQSLAFDKNGQLCARAPAFKESLATVILEDDKLTGDIADLQNDDQLLYEALVCGTRDYVEKNGFSGVLLGLSGGVDSALTLAIAIDALGASRVHAVMMPSRFTADISVEDAQLQLTAMKAGSSMISIEPVFETILTSLEPSFAGLAKDLTEENIQARIRGLFLMALSNKSGKLVLTTSNKSETAVGYATLYGDMAGGFAVLKDVLKTQVYALARYRNQLSPVIPERVLTRPPSAELAPNQTDQDSLPDYALLDAIIKAHMEQNLGAEALIQQGLPASDVYKTLKLIRRNEYKRRQSAPGIKVSPRAFGRDWRYPITSGFQE